MGYNKNWFTSSVDKVIGTVSSICLQRTNWSLNTYSSSKNLHQMEIIIQKAKTDNPIEPDDIEGDGVISPDASLAKELLKLPETERRNKIFIGKRGDHLNMDDDTIQRISNLIQDELSIRESSRFSNLIKDEISEIVLSEK
jgi:hypothetical protein